VSLALDTTRVDSSGDLACGRGRYALTLAPPGAGQVQDIGTYVVVYRRNAAGQWRAVEDIFNSDAPVLTA